MAVYACRSSVGAAGWTAAASGLSEVFLQTRSRLMTAIIGAAHHAAMTSGIVLLTGESGTGKRTLARQIHQWSSARGGRFTAVDCGAMSPSIRDEPFSRIICAGSNPLDRGTIFFAHIEDLSLKDQGLLLRFIETMS